MTFDLQRLAPLDVAVSALLLPLSVWVLISGFDDFLVDAYWAFQMICRRLPHRCNPPEPAGDVLRSTPERPIAIFVPAWREARVIGRMIEQNTAALQYRRYHFFIGVYPNDTEGLSTIRDLESRYRHVHPAMCPHNGPTSKADCLNWIYQRMLQFESESGERFEVIVTHDAEDVVHGDSLRWINYYSRAYAMVQIPVLPLPTPLTQWTHGVYSDEFSEYLMKDMPARQWLGAFVPSNGVGTGFRRDALEKLAAAESNRIFEPVCLTEDYENGYRLRAIGMRQFVVPLKRFNGGFVATREFFPQSFRAAVKQRTRWVTGISLQTWDRHGWKGDWKTKYWFWRDRKGLVGSPLSLLLNLVSAYGACTWLVSRWTGAPWGLEQARLPWELAVMGLSFGLSRIGFRCACVGYTFGPLYAAGAPLRMALGNAINSVAAISAIGRFATAKIRGRPLRWLKTEHAYPSQAALQNTRRLLGEVLVGSDYLSEERLQLALTTKPSNLRLGEHLLNLGFVSQNQVYEALSLQQGLPVRELHPSNVKASVARCLPAKLLNRWRVLPFQIESGRLYLAGPEPPSDELQIDLQRFTSLELRFHLITPGNFAELQARFL